MATFLFVLFLLIVVGIFFIVKKIYNEKYKNRKAFRRAEHFDKRIICNDYKVENIKKIKNKDSHVILIFQRKELEIDKNNIKYVSQHSEEKVEVNCNLPHKIKKEEVFNYLINNTYFYITEDRYNKLLSSSTHWTKGLSHFQLTDKIKGWCLWE